MNPLLEVFSFKYLLGSKQIWLYAYFLIYTIYALTFGIGDALLAVSIVVFALAPLRPSFLMFVFYLLWEYESTFSFGLTAVLVMQILMALKLFIQRKDLFRIKSNLKKKALSLQILLLVYIAIMGLSSFLLYKNFTGIGYVFKIIATFYLISFLHNERETSNVIRSIFQVIMISSLVATIYGFLHDTGNERWISGMGYVTQFHGTLGTTRMGLMYLIGFSYFLYYVNNSIIRYAGLIVFTLLLLMTVSITATIIYMVVILIYMYSFGKLRKSLFYIFLLSFTTAISFPLWVNFSPLQPIILRMTNSMDAYEQGDVNAAVSNREHLKDLYIDYLKEAETPKLIFGAAKSAMDSTGIEKNSHNTYIDIVYYFGMLGIVLLAAYQFEKILLVRKESYFYPYITLKIIFLLGCSTVSIMSATYFFFILFI